MSDGSSVPALYRMNTTLIASTNAACFTRIPPTASPALASSVNSRSPWAPHRLPNRLALLPDYKTLVSGSKDGDVCVWDTSVTHPRQRRMTFPDNVVGWRFSPSV